jgi:hypothetical protein
MARAVDLRGPSTLVTRFELDYQPRRHQHQYQHERNGNAVMVGIIQSPM